VTEIKQYGARGPLSDPPLLGEYVMVTYDDHLAAVADAVAAAEHRGYQQGIAEVIAWARESAVDGPAGSSGYSTSPSPSQFRQTSPSASNPAPMQYRQVSQGMPTRVPPPGR
jgi:hypothetical protein